MPKYTYNKSDFVNSPGNVPGFIKLEQDIKNSSIAKELTSSPSRRANGRSCFWSSLATDSETVSIDFADSLNGAEEITLDALVAAHTAGASYVPTFGSEGYICRIPMTWVTVSQVQIQAGRCTDRLTNEVLIVPSAQTMDATTTGAGGLDTGSLAASVAYAVYAIGDSTGAKSVSVLASTSFSVPTMPAGYDLYRQVGSFTTNGSSNIRNFAQWGKANQRRYEYREDRANLQALSSGDSSDDWVVLDVSSLIPESAIIGQFICESAVAVQGYVNHKDNGAFDGAILIGPSAKQVFDLGIIDQDIEWRTGSSGDLTIEVIGYTEDI